MRLQDILNEITGSEINKARLQKKSEQLKKQQQAVKQSISKETAKIKHQKDLQKYSKGLKKTVNESGDVSQILHSVGGKVIAFVHQTRNETRYFDSKRRLVAFENKNGTFNQYGTKVSPDAVGLFLVGIKSR